MTYLKGMDLNLFQLRMQSDFEEFYHIVLKIIEMN